MAYQITKASKVLMGLVVLIGAASLGWNLWKQGASAPVTAEKSPAKTESAAAYKSSGGKDLGTAENPLKVSLVSFHGYAPALVANGNSLKTKEGSIYAKKGVNVEFKIQDDIPTLTTIFESGAAQCAWRTSDFWAQEQPNLRNAGHDAKAVMIVDNTRGGDAIIARDPAIRSVEDLAGRKVALLQFTPSHGMTIDAVENSSLSARKRASVQYVYINAEEGTQGVRAAFESGNVDAAVLWDPDLSLAMRAKGAHVVYSTKTATNLIYDVMVCDNRVLKDPVGRAAVDKFVQGWMDGVRAANANPDNAVDALVETEDYFKQLAKSEGKPFIKSLFTNLVWTGLDENASILGMVGGTNHYERVYHRFDGIYRAAGALANPNSPVIPAQDSFDYDFIKGMLDNNKAAGKVVVVKKDTFTEVGMKVSETKGVAITKPVMVSFQSGSAVLTKRAQQALDAEMVPFIENNGSAYFELSGNTDSVGSEEINRRLSMARATAVRDYLVAQWEFAASRFKVVGNGPTRPLCNESNPSAEGLSLDECRAANRSTRIAVFQ